MHQPQDSVTLIAGEYAAEISPRGARLLALSHGQEDLVVPADRTEGGYAGCVLAPWPNRIAGASYTVDGSAHELAATEDSTGAALHGLITELDFTVAQQTEDILELTARLEATEGYPWTLDLVLRARLLPEAGLGITLMARQPVTETDAAGQEDQEADEDADQHAAADAAVADETAETLDAPAEDSDEDSGEETAETAADEADEAPATEESAETAEADETDEDAEAESAAQADETPAETPVRAPFGAGFHPYLRAGEAPLDECRLTLPASTVLSTESDGEVTGREPVSGDLDLAVGPRLDGRTIDHAYTDLPAEAWIAELAHDASGLTVRLIADTPWAQIFTGDSIGRAGVAVEPMTCPPDAFNSGEDVVRLTPGEWFRVGYSIEALRAD
ncbi:hypothetical protein GCM10027060_14710 [Nesterenkonia halophila]